jgi:hypothetical protein
MILRMRPPSDSGDLATSAMAVWIKALPFPAPPRPSVAFLGVQHQNAAGGGGSPVPLLGVDKGIDYARVVADKVGRRCVHCRLRGGWGGDSGSGPARAGRDFGGGNDIAWLRAFRLTLLGATPLRGTEFGPWARHSHQ